MKTNVIMRSQDRSLFGTIIRQETKTGFLNLSDLKGVYDKLKVKHGWKNKKVEHVLEAEENQERFFYLLKKHDNTIDSVLTEFIEDVQKQGIATTLKKYGVYKTTGARTTRTIWCEPYIWVLIAMEMNPLLYAEVVSWVTDKLIISRIEAGNFYKGLSKSISQFKDCDYIKIAKALNYIIFNRHEAGIRNNASQAELKELEILERQIAFSIDFGHLKTFEETINMLRTIYNKKYQNKF